MALAYDQLCRSPIGQHTGVLFTLVFALAVLAAWGYNGAREAEEARARGYAVCALDDFEATLFGPPRAP